MLTFLVVPVQEHANIRDREEHHDLEGSSPWNGPKSKLQPVDAWPCNLLHLLQYKGLLRPLPLYVVHLLDVALVHKQVLQSIESWIPFHHR